MSEMIVKEYTFDISDESENVRDDCEGIYVFFLGFP